MCIRDRRKRVIILNNNLSREKKRIVLAHELGHDMLHRDPVSYTHLDVYKRQGGYCAMGETLTQQRRVKEEGLRVVNFFKLSLIHIFYPTGIGRMVQIFNGYRRQRQCF